jgi:hypothetical protein
VVKTLVMEDEKAKPLIVLMHGNRKVSTKNLARQIGAKSVEPCKPKWPTGTAATWWAAPRRSARARRCRSTSRTPSWRLPRIAINGGRRGYLVGIEPAGVRALLDAKPVHCALARGLIGAAGRIRTDEPAVPHPRHRGRLPGGLAGLRRPRQPGHGPVDPRTFGSKNPGATNVLRSGSKPARDHHAAARCAEGLPAGAAGAHGRPPLGTGRGHRGDGGLAAFLGHLYPVFFRFKGGKGVATFIGVVFGIHWALGVATGLTWLIIAFFFRYSSLASLVAAVFAPVYYLLGASS